MVGPKPSKWKVIRLKMGGQKVLAPLTTHFANTVLPEWIFMDKKYVSARARTGDLSRVRRT